MFFYVDESGNTGLNLFDAAQPTLYYGVLGCVKNLDTSAEPLLTKLRARLGVKRLHASELGVGRLVEIAGDIAAFSKKNDLRFFLYKVEKRDHAVILFFDQVFDAGLNEAVAWAHYWTPMRYPLLFKVAFLFDEDLARRAWAARREQNPDRCAAQLIELCDDLLARTPLLPDARSRTLIGDALTWAKENTSEISYGSSNRESTLQISANLVGFQQVLQGIAMHTDKRGRKARRITVDRQTEFNTAQNEIADIYRKLRGHKTSLGPGMPKADWTTMPETPPVFMPGDESAGLELVDVTLWCAKKLEEEKTLPAELHEMFWSQARRGYRDEVSFHGLERRWSFLADLPLPEGAQREEIEGLIDEFDQRRVNSMAKL